MALSAASLKGRIDTYMAAIGATQTSDATTAQSYHDQMLLALCQGIVDEITSNAVVHTVDSRGDTCNNGTIT
jgi:uncharacterized membrane protein